MSNDEREAMELIEEYLTDVREHLPEDIADDVVEELRTHIIDESMELGGLTARNVYKVIRKLGDPRELASKYVVGRRKKVLSFEFGISEDLYPYFVQISFLISILLIIGYVIRIIYIIARYSSATSLIYVPMLLAELIVSIALTILLLYVIMSFFSSNPDLKSVLQKVLREIFGEPEKIKRKYFIREKKKEEIPPKKPEKPLEIKKEVKQREVRVRGVSTITRLMILIGAIFEISLAYLFYISTYYIAFNWLSMNFIMTIIIALVLGFIVDVSHFFYIGYTDKKSYLVPVINSLVSLIFIPWLMQVNIFTADLQIPSIDPELFRREDYYNFLKYIVMIPIPSDMLLLAKMLSLLFIVIIVVNAVISILKYIRTSPKRKAEEILLSMKQEE